MEYLIGVDIGTTQVKGSLLSVSGKLLAMHTVRHQPINLIEGHVEQDAEEYWWGDFLKVLRSLLAKSEIDRSRIVAIAVSGFYPNLCPTARCGEPLRRAILYSDNRAGNEVKFLNENLGLQETTEEIFAKLQWLRRFEPEIFNQTRMLFNPSNYVLYKLTGIYAIDYLSAYGFGALYNEQKGTWDQEICRTLSLSIELFPTIFASTVVVGGINSNASQITGLCQGTPVVMGTADSFATMLGANALEPGDCVISYGTSGLCLLLHDQMENLLTKKPSSMQKAMSTLTYLVSLGGSLEWIKDQFFNDESKTIASSKGINRLLDEKIQQIPFGAEGLVIIPYFLGLRLPIWEPEVRGLIYGLTLKHTKYHLWRAMLESFGYELLSGIEQAVQKGITIKNFLAAGGGAGSPIWRQIVSDIIGQTQIYTGMDASTADAFLAGYGIGVFDKMDQIKAWSTIMDVTEPKHNSQKYKEFYDAYQKVRSMFIEET